MGVFRRGPAGAKTEGILRPQSVPTLFPIVERMIANGAITTVKLADLLVTTAKIADSAITFAKMAAAAIASTVTDVSVAAATAGSASTFSRGDHRHQYVSGADGAIDATSGTSNDTSFPAGADTTDLSGPSVTIVVGSSGKAKVTISAQMSNDTTSAFSIVGVRLSGANAIDATLARALSFQQPSSVSGQDLQASRTIFFEGLTPGSTTFTMNYIVTAGIGTFLRREIVAVPL